jgi:hypothetical protein
MGLDNALAYPKTKPCSRLFFGNTRVDSVKRFKDVRQIDITNATPVITRNSFQANAGPG